MREIGKVDMPRETLDLLFQKDHKGTSVADCIDSPINVTGFALYDADGSYHLKFIGVERDATKVKDYYTSSQVFIKDFMRLAKLVDDDNFFITVTPKEGKSNKGRKYLYIEEAPKKGGNNSNWKSIDW